MEIKQNEGTAFQPNSTLELKENVAAQISVYRY